jgi:4-amino-4-deoxy-L-arabinose transferase-like glycosyltransferase
MTHRSAWALALITVIAALIRFLTLGHQSYDHDEAVTAARVLQPGLAGTWNAVVHGERSPPLYYLLAWAWSKAFGTGAVGLRSLSALFGTLTVPLAYRATVEFARPRAGLIAAAFVALNPYLVWYSQEARSYALLVLFSTLALVYFARSLRSPSRASLALWAVASGLALLSHYFAAFLIGPEAVLLLLASGRRRRTVAAVAAIAALGLALTPFAVTQEGNDRRNGFTQLAVAGRTGETLLNFAASEEPEPFSGTDWVDLVQAGAGAGGALLLVLAVGLVAARGSPEERLGALALGAVGGAALVLPILLAFAGADLLNPRNLIGSVVPLLVVAALGFGAQRAGRAGVAGALAGCVIFSGVLTAVYASAQMERPDWRGAAEAIGPAAEPRILVVPHNGDDPLAYYLDAHKLKAPRFPHGLRVREIDVLSTSYEITPPGHGFRLVDQEGLAPLFVLRRFRAVRLERVRVEQVSGDRVLHERSSALVDARGEREASAARGASVAPG